MDTLEKDKQFYLKSKYVETSEFEYLKNKFENLSKSDSSVVLLKGDVGEGKSKIIELFIKHIKGEKNLVLSAKCFKNQRKIPHIVFKEILNKYIKYYDNYSDEKKIEIKRVMNDYLGVFGKILLNIYPPLKKVIDKYDDLVALDFSKEKLRMNIVMNSFFKGACKLYHSLVIIIDDLQWIDEGSFEVLSSMVEEFTSNKLLIVCTYCCDNELDGEFLSGLRYFIEDEKKGIKKLPLKGFSIDKLKELLNLELIYNEKLCNEIYDFINSKSRGNQYYISELLRYLSMKNIIKIENSEYVFDWDKLRVMNISNYVDDLVIERVNALTDIKKTIVDYAVVIGGKFDIEILFQLLDLNENTVLDAISELIDEDLLERDIFINYKISFYNTRVREILYRNIDTERKTYFNLKIANLMEFLYTDNEDKYFMLSHYYLEGNNYNKSVKLLYEVGLIAKRSLAFNSASDYFEKVKNIIERKYVEDENLYISCLENLGEIYFALGQMKEAVNIYEEVLINLLKDKLKKADIYKIVSDAYLNVSDYKNCKISVERGLNLLGKKLPKSKMHIFLSFVKEIMIHLFLKIYKEDYLFERRQRLRKDKLKEYKLFINFLINVNWVYAMNDTDKFLLLTLKALNVSKSKIINTIEYSKSLLSYAVVLMNIPFFKFSKVYFQKSLSVKKKMGDKFGIAELYYFMGHYSNWSGSFKEGVKYGKKSIKLLKEIGDFSELGMAFLPVLQGYYYLGEYKNLKIINDQLYKYALNINNNYMLAAAEALYLQLYRDRGKFEEAEKHGLKSIDIAFKEMDWFSYTYANIEIGNLFIETEQYSRAIVHLDIARKVIKKHRFLKNYIVSIYSNYAEAYILNFVESYGEHSNKDKKKYLRVIYKLCKTAIDNTKKWIVHYGNSLRIMAKYYILKENLTKAEEFFLESINVNKNINKKFDLAKSFYDYGEFLKLELRKKESEKYLEMAYEIFIDIENKYYLKKIDKELDIRSELKKDIYKKDVKKSKKIDSIISLSNNINAILDIDILLKRVLEIVMDITEAENGYILLKDDFSGKIQPMVEIIYGKKKCLSENIVREVINKGKTILTNNVYLDDRYLNYQVQSLNDVREILCLPIKYNDEVKGVCFLDTRSSDSVFSLDDVGVVNTILTQTAISIDNLKLFKMAITDGLTGLLTNRHFKYLLKIEIQRSSRYNKEFGIAMIDLDYFKRINDKYGHLAGDFILSSISDIMKNSFRDSDILSRYGGEEFAILLTETNKDGIIKSLERFRERIRNYDFIFDKKSIKVTISIGVTFAKIDNLNEKELLKQADLALYMSKKNGRDQISVYSNKEEFIFK